MRKIAVINSGDELLCGSAVNTNLAFLGVRLCEAGLPISSVRVIPDEKNAFFDALAESCRNADILIVSGGLGATRDDVTRVAVSRFFGLRLEEHSEIRRRLLYFWRIRHGKERIPKIYFRQALLPEGAKILLNRNGSAPGCVFDARLGEKIHRVYLLPGPPSEFEPMVEEFLLPDLLESTASESERHFRSGFLACGVGELRMQQLAEEMLGGEAASVAYCANPSGTRVFCTDSTEAGSLEKLEKLRAACGVCALPAGTLDLEPFLLELLRRKKWSLGGAESCTGGMISSRLVDVPGSSDVFRGSFVVYSNEWKMRHLGIPDSLLAEHGAVSAECARAMLDGILVRENVDCAFAVTGVAGPGGGTEEKPVGLVYIGVAVPGKIRVEKFQFPGNRRRVRERSVAMVLRMLFEEMIQLS